MNIDKLLFSIPIISNVIYSSKLDSLKKELNSLKFLCKDMFDIHHTITSTTVSNTESRGQELFLEWWNQRDMIDTIVRDSINGRSIFVFYIKSFSFYKRTLK